MAVRKVSLGTLVAALGATALAGAGCYSPSVVDGKLLCGPSNACPDDFSCVDGRCWRGGVMTVDSGSTDDGPPPARPRLPAAPMHAERPGCGRMRSGVPERLRVRREMHHRQYGRRGVRQSHGSQAAIRGM